MGCNIPLADNACSAERDSFSIQVIYSAADIVAEFFPDPTILTQRWTLLDIICESGT